MSMKTSVLLLGGILAVLFSSGCASIVSGRNQDIHVTSEPPGVKVEAENGVSVTTPGELTLVRNKPHTLVAKYAEADPQQKELRSDLNGWVFGNILFGGIIGAVVDFASGASGKLTPDAIHFDFTEAGKARMRRKMEYLKAHPDVDERVRFAIMHEKPRNRMSKDELVAALGEPDQIVPEKKYEKYVYESRDPKYYYVRNDAIERIVK